MNNMPIVYRWLLTGLIAAPGFFFIFATYYCMYLGYKNRNNPDAYTPSGVPCTGGIILIIAFLLSPCKWLAFLGLIDYGLWYLPYLLITGLIGSRKK
ncbi:MAG: hypothetical protein J6Y71_09395 [Ruminococcus sp.]|nr:hypothetical protein [Ruminococcus sp.]